MIPHWECITNEEVELTTPMQYVMSGSTPGISREKGGVQVREIMESNIIGLLFSDSMTPRRPMKENVKTLAYVHVHCFV